MFYCPKCKSQEIFAAAGGYMGQVYLCSRCGYRGSFILEVDDAEIAGETEKDKKDTR